VKSSQLRGVLSLLTLVLAVISAGAADEPVLDPDVDIVLTTMGAMLTAAESFRFTAENTADIVVDDIWSPQSAWTTKFTVRRPDRLLVLQSSSDDDKTFYYDGKSVALHFLDLDMYTRIEAPAIIDEALDMILHDYGIILPVADMIYNDCYEVLTSKLEGSYYGGLQQVVGVSCHHLVFNEETIDWQLWVEDGDRPLPRKMMITYRQAEGSTTVTSYFLDWEFSAPTPDALFDFEPGSGVDEIKTMAVVDRATGEVAR
jgi:hypothetical protein